MASEEQTSAVFGEGGEQAEPHFEPIHRLTEADRVAATTGEEDEDELFKMRAKLFRFEKAANEWKERGTGDLRILQHKQSTRVRLVMRRDKTHKVCANHYILPDMKLAPNVGSDRSWVWTVLADMSEGEPAVETLAVRFANSENANLFKSKFEDAQSKNSTLFGGASNTADAAPQAPVEGKAESSTALTTAADDQASTSTEKSRVKDDAPAYEQPPATESDAPAVIASDKKEPVADSKAAEAAEDAERAKADEGEAPPTYT